MGKRWKGKWKGGDDKEWHAERPKRTDCDYHREEEEPTVTLRPQAILKVLAMVQANPDTEFMVYFFGNAEERIMEDVYVPKQDASMGGVHMTEDIEFPGIVGVLHKHPGNGKPSFSGTDENCLNNNHQVSIVIPQNGALENWHGIVRFLPPCGCERIVEAKLVFDLSSETEAMSKEKLNAERFPRNKWGGWGDDKELMQMYGA